MLDKSVIDIR